ncbi:hypothetical protein HDV06_001342 [Boothiomyces sp. JEL0866]|nr:hypothetical protein HDV06_001338 [Boothiomyces sp. JEL0866]KAJ3317652.1 hypothetical protein HDV06_001342 [Boothiomyces sp. JEL0866]
MTRRGDFKAIVAATTKHGIGYKNALPWRLSKDMEFFKTTTISKTDKPNVVIMGKKTFDSIPKRFRPLVDRVNIVLTRQSVADDSVIYCNSVEQVFHELEKIEHQNVFVIGGKMIYELFYEYIETFYLTRIYTDFECDTFLELPEYFKTVEKSEMQKQGDVEFEFQVLKNTNSN